MMIRVLLILLGLCAGCFFGPTLIHWSYRLGTTDVEREAKKGRYHELAHKEAFVRKNAGAGREKPSEERRRIFYWFHARGWPIDEGWCGEGMLGEKKRQWRDLFQYWEL